MKLNKREFPADFVNIKFQDRKEGSSFFFDDNMTAVSYRAKENKLVSLLSTMHDSPAVNETTSKHEIVLNYNETKGGVDSFDQESALRPRLLRCG